MAEDTSTLVSEGLMDNNPVDTDCLRVGREARYGTLAWTTTYPSIEPYGVVGQMVGKLQIHTC